MSMEPQETKIGNVRVLLYLNPKSIEEIRLKGIEWPEAISYFMAKNFGSEDELVISSERVTLSEVSKIRCQTTPIYRDNGGGIYVLFEELDNENKLKEGMEFLGTIDPKRYAAALCAELGVKSKNIFI